MNIELNKIEEKISKQKAKQLFDSGLINNIEVGTFKGLAKIHKFLFEEVYEFAGKVRTVNIAKKDFRFAPVIYLDPALKSIDKMPQNTYDAIIEKYVEMNVVHPFMEGNGRSTRIWLDLMLRRSLKLCVDWSRIDKNEYLRAMRESVVDSSRIKALIKGALTDKINDREMFMKGIDYSYYYEEE